MFEVCGTCHCHLVWWSRTSTGRGYAPLPIVFVQTMVIENPRRGILYGPGQQLGIDDGRGTLEVRTDVGDMIDGDGLDHVIVIDREPDDALLVAGVGRGDEVLAAIFESI